MPQTRISSPCTIVVPSVLINISFVLSENTNGQHLLVRVAPQRLFHSILPCREFGNVTIACPFIMSDNTITEKEIVTNFPNIKIELYMSIPLNVTFSAAINPL